MAHIGVCSTWATAIQRPGKFCTGSAPNATLYRTVNPRVQAAIEERQSNFACGLNRPVPPRSPLRNILKENLRIV
ncbi:hypothetical protein CBM2586_B130650 [Cupriavidus phytorum]|uniref:Uncharacterized protein n=1 Tax=Cupriavidus taiwanensis TaxID=164546 RepID=A0A976AAC5_9BURK|nr:hypothetical protein CBM2586_B130650 [Cupriavidus taiwanensis]